MVIYKTVGNAKKFCWGRPSQASGRRWDEETCGGEEYVQFECDEVLTDVFVCQN